jgi:hypothetical protein
MSDLTDAQLDGLACVVCGSFDRPMVPVGNGPRGQLFACVEHEREAMRHVPRTTKASHFLDRLDVDAMVAGYQAGHSLRQIGGVFGVNHNTVRHHVKAAGVPLRNGTRGTGLPRAENSVDLAALRAAWQTSGLTVADVARAMNADEGQAARLLGTRATSNTKIVNGQHRRYRSLQQRCHYDTAVRLCRALPNVDPVDLGL